MTLKTVKIIYDKFYQFVERISGKRFTYHPHLKIKIEGFQVPNRPHMLKFVKECALNYELNYVAWDIAVHEKDYILIEADPSGMTNVIQIAGACGQKKQYCELKRLFQKQMQK